MFKKKSGENVMLMVPMRNTDISWNKDEEKITLVIKRQKKIDTIMHKIFKTPNNINIELDELGSFVWEKCNGKNNLIKISNDMKEQFGKKAEPTVERLVTYIKILKNNKFISLK